MVRETSMLINHHTTNFITGWVIVICCCFIVNTVQIFACMYNLDLNEDLTPIFCMSRRLVGLHGRKIEPKKWK